jgi:hypothetical protein
VTPINSKLINDAKIIKMGSKDKMFRYKSHWPIYILHTLDENGIWIRIQTRLEEYENKKILTKIKAFEIDDFLMENSDITFEMDFFKEMMNNFYFFKFKDRMYAYTTGKKGVDKVRIYTRFYFNLDDILT